MKTKTLKARVMWANYYPEIVCCAATLKLAKHRADYKLSNQTIRVAVIPLCDVEAIVERANSAFQLDESWGFKESVRAALIAAGIPCRKVRK